MELLRCSRAVKWNADGLAPVVIVDARTECRADAGLC